MTEDEAKTKWCPFARTIDFVAETTRQGEELQLVGGSVNREIGPYNGNGDETVVLSGRHRCIGSACMAWRRQVVARDYTFTGDPEPIGEGWAGTKDSVGGIEWVRHEGGFCGLAGAPL